MSKQPSPNRTNGRDSQGRFVKGHPGGPGNPHGRKVAALRSALLDAVTPEELRRVARKLLALAEAGDVAAARELFDRTVGRPIASDLESKFAELEAIIQEMEQNR